MAETRTRWNDDEKARLSAAALPLLLSDKRLSIIEAVRNVQDTVLPAERRRSLVNIGALPVDLRTSLENRRKAASGDAQFVDASELGTANAAIAKLEEENKVLRDAVTSLRKELLILESRPIPPEPLEVFKDIVADILRRSTASLQEHAGITLPVRIITPEHKHNPEGESADAPRLPKVLICGLKPHQRAYFESSLNGRVRISWWMDESFDKLKDKARNADMTYLMMGATSHSAVACVSSVTENFQRIATFNREEQKNMIEGWLAKRGTNGAKAEAA